MYKAAEYFKIQLIRVGVDKEGRMRVDEVKKKINKNTILIYTSAPSYPHGAIDPIAALSEIALAYDCCLHVDACLGGFVLPFLKRPMCTKQCTYQYNTMISASPNHAHFSKTKKALKTHETHMKTY